MKEDLETIIGLEVHVQLKTQSGMFCRCSVGIDDAPPNTHICAVCLGQVGALPLINKKAVELCTSMGLALECEISKHSKWDRKNYFYPDLPKGYQISQYDLPLCAKGKLEITRPDGTKFTVRIHRIHLEEDAAKTMHKGDKTLVDFNRSGTPLAELVTEPDLRSVEDARLFLQELQLIVRSIGASHADMEKGHLRCDASISLRPMGETKLYPRTEIKNLNSFRNVERALAYEVKKQSSLWQEGKPNSGDITVLWDDAKQSTRLMRDKESAADYRYFPEPDIPEVELAEEYVTSIKLSLPELPSAKRKRYARDYSIKREDIESYVTDLNLANFFESVAEKLGNIPEKVKLASNYITSDLAGHLAAGQLSGEDMKLPSHEHFAKLINMISTGELSSRGGKDVLLIMHKSGGDPEVIARENNLIQKHDEGELIKIVEQVIKDNEKVVADYKAGKQASLQYLVGQGMKASKGNANPTVLSKLLITAMASEAPEI